MMVLNNKQIQHKNIQKKNSSFVANVGSGGAGRVSRKRRTGSSRKEGRGAFGEGRFHSEFEHKVLGIRRVARVVAGGRRFSFSVVVAAGDRAGRVGVGIGKAADTANAIDKALNKAKKNMLKVSLTKDNSIPFETRAKYGAAIIFLRPVFGRSLVAGSVARDILELAGVHGVSAKFLSRSKNKFNNANTVLKALSQLNHD